MELITDKYKIEIYEDPTFEAESADNVNKYDFIYLDDSLFRCSSVFGVRVIQSKKQIASVIIASNGGGTVLHNTSTLLEEDKVLVCCSDTIFCLSIPTLTLLWKTKADQATCFEIFNYKDKYIVHGELEISMLDKDGNIIWQQSGADIFTTIGGKNDFALENNYIVATDWQNNKYKFDYDGHIIK
jgi:hypothetical protein